jgi:hypothetical protein
VPEPNAAAGIAKQIKASGRAYPVFGTSKLFLERPERHRVRVTSSDPAVPLFQIGDGPISFDRANVERNAFFSAKDEYYLEETIQGEPIKGNFSNVARVRGTGTLLGPTNYHGYQPALRKVYEERFSRRMAFPEFQQYEIEIVSDEQTVADWKEQARTTTNYTTTKEAEPIVFKSAFDAEQHFRKQYLPQIVKSGQMLECSGQASRVGADRFVGSAVRAEWEKESHFPQQIVNGLRPYFVEVGLHFFKHRKRVLYVSATKPLRHPAGQVFSDGITAILRTVEATPRLKRPDLASKLLGEQPDSPEVAPRKEQLASDLHYLIHSGHVIEFSNGMLELPLAPQEKVAKAPNSGPPANAGTTVDAVETAEEPTSEAVLEQDPTPPAEEEIASPTSEMPTALQEAVTTEVEPETEPTAETSAAEPSVANTSLEKTPATSALAVPSSELHASDPSA